MEVLQKGCPKPAQTSPGFPMAIFGVWGSARTRCLSMQQLPRRKSFGWPRSHGDGIGEYCTSLDSEWWSLRYIHTYTYTYDHYVTWCIWTFGMWIVFVKSICTCHFWYQYSKPQPFFGRDYSCIGSTWIASAAWGCGLQFCAVFSLRKRFFPACWWWFA